jgi:hypothetical protein
MPYGVKLGFKVKVDELNAIYAKDTAQLFIKNNKMTYLIAQSQKNGFIS